MQRVHNDYLKSLKSIFKRSRDVLNEQKMAVHECAKRLKFERNEHARLEQEQVEKLVLYKFAPSTLKQAKEQALLSLTDLLVIFIKTQSSDAIALKSV